MTSFIIEFFRRLSTGSPSFFVKLRKGMIIFGLALLSVKILIASGIIQVSEVLRQTLLDLLNQFLIAIGTVSGFSFLPVDNPNTLHRERPDTDPEAGDNVMARLDLQ